MTGDKMPVSNTVQGKQALGTNHREEGASSAVKGAKQGNTHKGNHMPTANVPTRNASLGTTKHGVGEVPAYLKGK